MEKLRFKTFVWPVNPKEWSEETVREPVYEKNALDEQIFQGLGPLKRVIIGSGAFSGTQAHSQYAQLAALLEETVPGILNHPHWGERNVFFTGLQMSQEPREDYVAYRFEFRQADENGNIPC